VVTPEGWLYDKEAVLQYIVDKKAEYQKKLAAFEKQRDREFAALHSQAKKDEKNQREQFEKREKNISQAGTSKTASSSKSSAALPSFWVPALTPDPKEVKVERPSKGVFCPMSGKPLRAKDLIAVKFTLIDPEDEGKKSLISKEERYRCPVTGDILRNSGEAVVIRTTGDVVTKECVETIIKKDMTHPLTGEKLEERDLVPLQRGGTGYAAANAQLKAKHYRPNLAIS